VAAYARWPPAPPPPVRRIRDARKRLATYRSVTPASISSATAGRTCSRQACPALLKRVDRRGVSDKELSELLARDLLIPVVHETTYDELRKVSPLLASRNGLNTADDSIADVATKIAELVAVEDNLAAPLASAD
jgi:hypothetical protein